MNQLMDIFDGFFYSAEGPAVIFDKSGRAVWQNEYVAALIENNDELLPDVYKEICCIGSKAGAFKIGGGGAFRTIRLTGEEYIAAEFRSTDSSDSLYVHPDICSLIMNNEAYTKRSVSDIYNICELISQMDCSPCIDDFIEMIMKSCLRITRTTKLGALIANASELSGNDRVCISVDDFLSVAAENINRILPKSCTASYSGRTSAFINADEDLLIYLLLGLINMFDAAQSGLEFRLELSAEADEDSVKIFVKAYADENVSPVVDLLPLKLLCENVSRTLGAEFVSGSDSAEILMKRAEKGIAADLKSVEYLDSRHGFTPYTIMLSEAEDFTI